MDEEGNVRGYSSSSISSVAKWFSVEGVAGEVVFTFVIAFLIMVVFAIKLAKYLKSTTTDKIQPLVITSSCPSFNRFEDPCPVCFDAMTFGVLTSCSHLFCGDCVMRLLECTSFLDNLSCPVCRSDASSLTPVLLDEPRDLKSITRQNVDREIILTELQEYNELFSDGRSLLKRFKRAFQAVRRLQRVLANPVNYQDWFNNPLIAMLYLKAVIVAVCVVFPFNFIPEKNLSAHVLALVLAFFLAGVKLLLRRLPQGVHPLHPFYLYHH